MCCSAELLTVPTSPAVRLCFCCHSRILRNTGVSARLALHCLAPRPRRAHGRRAIAWPPSYLTADDGDVPCLADSAVPCRCSALLASAPPF
eukprot:2018839-Amphidinium_carterae.1